MKVYIISKVAGKVYMLCTCGSMNFERLHCSKCKVNHFACCNCGKSLDPEFSKEYIGEIANQYVKKHVLL